MVLLHRNGFVLIGDLVERVADRKRPLNVSMEYLVGWTEDPTPAHELSATLSTRTVEDLDASPTDDPEGHLKFDDEDLVGINEVLPSAESGAAVIQQADHQPRKVPATVPPEARPDGDKARTAIV